MRKFFALLLAVLMLGALATVAFATDDNPSPTGGVEFEIEIDSNLPSYVADSVEVVKDGDTFTYTAKDIDGYNFSGFVIEGDYEIVYQDGNTIVIRPKGDVKVHVEYDEVPPAEPKPQDKGDKSPRTADPSMLLLAVLLVGACGSFVAAKRLRKE